VNLELKTASEEVRKMEEKRCLVVVDGKECGLPLTPVADKPNVYQCAEGHRSTFVPEPIKNDPVKDADA
jgi:hypothetical protein